MADQFAVGRSGLPHSGSVMSGTVLDVNGTTTNSDDVGNLGAGGVVVIIDVTAVANSPSVVFTVQGKDRVSGKYYDLLASAAITATGTTRLRIHPDLTASANAAASDLLPDIWRVKAVGGASAGATMTFTVGACLVP